mgnify:CR=1 FL=1
MDTNIRNTAAHIMPVEDNQFGYSNDDDMISENTIPFLNIDKLREEERSTDRTRQKMYKLILAKCHSKIRRTNNSSEYRECFFDIPLFLPGFPVYSVKEATRFVIEQLQQNGIYAQQNGDTRIYISWKNEDVNYDQYKVQSEKMAPKNNVYKIQNSKQSSFLIPINALTRFNVKDH